MTYSYTHCWSIQNALLDIQVECFIDLLTRASMRDHKPKEFGSIAPPLSFGIL